MPNTGPEYARAFAMHRAALIELLEQIPADKTDFVAWDGGRSFKSLTDHLSGSIERVEAMLRGEAPGKPEPSADWPATLERLRQTTQSMTARLEALPPETLTRVIPAFGGIEMPVWALVDFIIQHEAHHKGQVWVMARMIGVQPPMFVKMG